MNQAPHATPAATELARIPSCSVYSNYALADMSVPPPNLESVMTDHGPFLRRLAHSLVRNSADADDVVQDVWVAAATSAGPIREPQAWLASVLRRRVASERRKQRPQAMAEGLDQAHPREAAQDVVAQQLERETKLQLALTELGEPYRTALYLRFHDGLKPKAIAERMDAPVKTVNSWLSRGLQRLRISLDGAYGGGEEGRAAWLSGMTLLATGARTDSLGAATQPAVGAATGANASAIAAIAAGVAITIGAGLWWTQRDGGLAPLNVPGHGTALASSQILSVPPASGAPSSGARPELAIEMVTTAPGSTSRTATAGGSASAMAPGSTGAPTSQEASGDGAVTLEVTVRGPDGDPAPDQVLVIRQNGWRGVPAESTLATTDPEGKVSLLVDSHLAYMITDLVGSSWIYVFYGEEEISAEATLAKELVLRPTTTISGRVLNGEGEAQPGATIFAMATDNSPPIWFPIGQADDTGRYEIQGGKDMCFEAVVPGRLPSEAVVVQYAPASDNGGREVDLVVGAPGAALTGRVLNSGGLPVEGAAVMASSLGRVSGSLEYTRRPSPVLAFTDADGRFTYPFALPPGEQPIAVSAPGFAIRSFVETFDGQAKDLSVTLIEGVTIEGRVVQPDGSPSPKTRVHLHEPGTRWYDSFYGPNHGVYTDEEGRFQLRHVGATAGELFARNSSGTITNAALPWSASNAGPVELQLDEGRVIAGRVINEFGLPLPGLLVNASTDQLLRSQALVTTNAQGEFRLTSLPQPVDLPAGQSESWTVAVRTNTNAMHVVIAEVGGVTPGTMDVEIVATAPGAATAFIEGRVVHPEGVIPGNAILFFSHQTGGKLTEETNHSIDFDRETGDFRHGPLAAGHYGLILHIPEEGEVASIEGIEVGASSLVEVGDLTIGSGGTATLSLAVELPAIFPDGILTQLINDQRLELVSAHRRYEMEAIENGWRTSHPLPAGTYELQRRSGEILCIPRMPITIQSGANIEVQVEALVGRPMMFWTLMDPDGDWENVELRFYSSSNELVQISRTRDKSNLNEEDSIRFLEAVPMGPTRVEVWIDGAATAAQVNVTVLDFTEPMDPITIDVR